MWGGGRACVGAIGAFVLLGGCLDPNPDFDGPASEASSAAETASSATETASSATETASDEVGDSSTGAVCQADGYEPNDDASAAITFGSFSLVLESVDAIDRYSLWFGPEAPELLQATAVGDVRLCGYVRCENDPEAPQIECTQGLSGGDGDGNPGCCGGSAFALGFVCGGDTSAKVYVVADQAGAECTSYELELVNG